MEKAFLVAPTFDAFKQFDLAPSFDLNEEELYRRYKKAILSLHPDHYLSAPEWLKEKVDQEVAQWNQSYQSLKNPLERARLLFLHYHIDVERAELPKALLSKIFEWHLSLETASEMEKKTLQDSIHLQYQQELNALMLYFKTEQRSRAAQAYQCLRALYPLMKRLGSQP